MRFVGWKTPPDRLYSLWQITYRQPAEICQIAWVVFIEEKGCWCAQPLPLWQKAAAGLTAGGLGALVGSPADLTLIRMQADSTLPLESRRNYKGVGDAMVRTRIPSILIGRFSRRFEKYSLRILPDAHLRQQH
jgi:hypothetical protein